jgi:hypothetical protein
MTIARTRPLAGPAPHPGEMLKDELEARGLSPHALAIAPATGLANKPDRSRPASDYAGNRAAPRPLFRRLGGDLPAPSDGLRPRARRSRTRCEDRGRGHASRRVNGSSEVPTILGRDTLIEKRLWKGPESGSFKLPQPVKFGQPGRGQQGGARRDGYGVSWMRISQCSERWRTWVGSTARLQR